MMTEVSYRGELRCDFLLNKLCKFHVAHLEVAEEKCLLTQFTQTQKWGIKRIQKRERKNERENCPSSEQMS